MDDYNILRTQRLTRVETFCTENASDILPGSKIAALVAQLKPVSQKLEEARVSQLRGPVGKKARIEALLVDYKDIARTSRAIGLDEPDFPVAAFRHPATAVETTVTTHADALLLLLEDQPADTPGQKTAKAALRAKFIAYELPADFVEDLRADRDALSACNAAKHSDNQEGVEGTAEIETLLAQAREIITRLDAAFLNKYRSNPAKIAAWKSASRVERVSRKAKTPGTVPPPVG